MEVDKKHKALVLTFVVFRTIVDKVCLLFKATF